MRFLILGLGSIGQRHCRILRELLGNSVELFAYRQRNINVVINDNMSANLGKNPEDAYNVTLIDDLKSALSLSLDGVYITNPVFMHVDTALKAAEAGHNIFLEKPLSHNMENIGRLIRVSNKKKLVTMVGYQLRYHIGLRTLKKHIDSKTIGTIISADIHFGEWLPGMHPYEDYRDNHISIGSQGGGVINCLSHEIDYARWLFGMPRSVVAMGGHLSCLEMKNAEDSVDLMLDFGQNDTTTLPVHIHLDFLQKPARRYACIIGDKGLLYWDYYANTVECKMHDSKQSWIESYPNWKRNDMFLDEVKNFIASINGRESSDIPFSDAAYTTYICNEALESLKTNKIINLSYSS